MSLERIGLKVFLSAFFVLEMLNISSFKKKFTYSFGLYYKVVYLCSAIRMKCAKSALSAGGRRRHKRELQQHFLNHQNKNNNGRKNEYDC
jgi:hypothetical protein